MMRPIRWEGRRRLAEKIQPLGQGSRSKFEIRNSAHEHDASCANPGEHDPFLSDRPFEMSAAEHGQMCRVDVSDTAAFETTQAEEVACQQDT